MIRKGPIPTSARGAILTEEDAAVSKEEGEEEGGREDEEAWEEGIVEAKTREKKKTY